MKYFGPLCFMALGAVLALGVFQPQRMLKLAWPVQTSVWPPTPSQSPVLICRHSPA